jgi:hypothetical protein
MGLKIWKNYKILLHKSTKIIFSGPSGFAQFSEPLGSGLGSYLVKSPSPSHLYLENIRNVVCRSRAITCT